MAGVSLGHSGRHTVCAEDCGHLIIGPSERHAVGGMHLCFAPLQKPRSSRESLTAHVYPHLDIWPLHQRWRQFDEVVCRTRRLHRA
jgi:hypothetical protein